MLVFFQLIEIVHTVSDSHICNILIYDDALMVGV